MALSSPQVIEENTESDKLQKYSCDICRNKCVTPGSLAQHLLSKKHRHQLKLSKSQEPNVANRLSSFMKAHMNEDPIVGLEYIIESKKDSSYTYTCQLCGLLICPLPTIVAHISHSKHTKCYISKHFPHLLPQFEKFPKKDNVKSVRDAAVTILELQGNKKEIQEVLPENDGKMREASEDTPPSKPESDGKMREASEDTPPSKPESDGKMREASEDTPPPSKPESDGKMREASEDTPPSKPESDGKTQGASKDPPPSKPESDGKTQGASKDPPPSKSRSDGKMRVAIKDPPPSKPESDGKTRGASKDTRPPKPESDVKMRVAIKDPPPSKPESDGKTRGASKDTPPSKPESDVKMRVAIKDPPPSKPESDGKMRVAIKDTPPSKPESDGKTRGASKDTPPSKSRNDGKMREAIKDTPPSKPKSGNLSQLKLSPLPYQEKRKSYRYNKVLQKFNSNDPPLAKRSRRCPGGDWDVLPSTAHTSKHESSHYNKSHAIRRDCPAPQELEFRTNDEFFEYFANFVISNDEDVVFIRTITQNCIKALTRFKQEEIERRKTSH
ncbi:neurofilament heavy polypeptide-like [Rana temporaria]|uniref:neurofilament heavy polypeptide-like n=1 Tax=Rana temporaria TaxID=8407 RepID=UPI001AACE349|nr:neurofilament heavy polypeptide-like [Rana temporaria]